MHQALIRHQEAHLFSETAPSLGNESDQGLRLQDLAVSINSVIFLGHPVDELIVARTGPL